MNRGIIRHGFVLILLALISGLFIPAVAIPRLALSAHTIGILSGVLLITIGAVWTVFSLSPRQSQLMYWSWIYSSFVNWIGCLIAGVFGTGRTTPLASAGKTGTAIAEGFVGILLISVAVVSFVAVALSIWGLRRQREAIS